MLLLQRQWPTNLCVRVILIKQHRFLNILLQQNPEDESLKEILDRADKEVRENRILRTLGGWLNNIKDIKASRSIAE